MSGVGLEALPDVSPPQGLVDRLARSGTTGNEPISPGRLRALGDLMGSQAAGGASRSAAGSASAGASGLNQGTTSANASASGSSSSGSSGSPPPAGASGLVFGSDAGATSSSSTTASKNDAAFEGPRFTSRIKDGPTKTIEVPFQIVVVCGPDGADDPPRRIPDHRAVRSRPGRPTTCWSRSSWRWPSSGRPPTRRSGRCPASSSWSRAAADRGILGGTEANPVLRAGLADVTPGDGGSGSSPAGEGILVMARTAHAFANSRPPPPPCPGGQRPPPALCGDRPRPVRRPAEGQTFGPSGPRRPGQIRRPRSWWSQRPRRSRQRPSKQQNPTRPHPNPHRRPPRFPRSIAPRWPGPRPRSTRPAAIRARAEARADDAARNARGGRQPGRARRGHGPEAGLPDPRPVGPDQSRGRPRRLHQADREKLKAEVAALADVAPSQGHVDPDQEPRGAAHRRATSSTSSSAATGSASSTSTGCSSWPSRMPRSGSGCPTARESSPRRSARSAPSRWATCWAGPAAGSTS